jgi:hypothetical protein
MVLHTLEHSRTDQIVSQFQPARRCSQLAGWLELTNDAFYLIGSAVFQCVEYQ